MRYIVLNGRKYQLSEPPPAAARSGYVLQAETLIKASIPPVEDRK